jgi:hypothetical protein
MGQVVPEASAELGLPNEVVFPVNAHHRNICRYPSEGNQTYVLVEAAIKELMIRKNASELPISGNIDLAASQFLPSELTR